MSNDKFESDIDDWMNELGGEDNPFDDDEPAAAADSPADSPEEAGESDDAPIDQDAINALMDGADDVAAESEDDDQGPVDPTTLEASTDDGADEAPVDQDAIDALMAGDDDTPAESQDEDAPVDQDAIDALMAGDDDTPAESQEEDAPVDQDAIDALMAGDDDAADEPKEESSESIDAAPAGDDASMSQDELDALLNGSDSDESDGGEEEQQIDQSEIDALFGGEDEDTGGGEEELDALLTDSPDEGAEEEPASQTEMDELFAETDDVDGDLFGTEPVQEEPESGMFDFAGDELSDGEDDSAGPAQAADADETIIEEPPKRKFKFTPPAWLGKVKDNRAMWTGLGIFVALLIGTGGYFSFFKKDEQPAIPIPSTDMMANNTTTMPVTQQTQPVLPVNTTPMASLESMDIQIAMNPTAEEVKINLAAGASEEHELEYLITSFPTEGILQGNPPELTYTPAPGFSGKDGFEYRTTDGRALSTPANVFIMGQARQAEAKSSEPKIIEPRMPLVKAVDLTLKTVSTDKLNINWRRVWEQANGSSFNRKVKVKILGKTKHGKLTRLSRHSHRYAPDPYGSGLDTVSYQFNLAGVQSKTKRLKIKVIQGDPPPALKLGPMGKERYAVGETVMIDASATRDDSPASLTFSWQQMAGVPVQIEPLNQTGSLVSFIVPSSFYTADYPKPVINLVVTDATGQTAKKKITINAGHGSKAARWNGLHEHGLARVDKGTLPWEY